MCWLKAFLQKAQLSDGKWERNHHAHSAHGSCDIHSCVTLASDRAVRGLMTDKPHVLLLCTEILGWNLNRVIKVRSSKVGV